MQYTNIYSATLKWYNKNKRDLPWRISKDPYKIWLSEIMLQQTQVNTVIPYYTSWLKRYKTIHDVANADIDELLKSWEGLGYYSRCRNFYDASKIVVEKYNGAIPDTYEEFILLPGVGNYIANAVLSMAYNKNLAAIDVNLKRVFCRMLGFKKYTKHNIKKIEKLAFRLTQLGQAGDLNQAIMDIGSQICTPRRPLCDKCPNRKYCKAYASGNPHRYPEKIQAKKLSTKKMIAALIMLNDKFLIVKRKEKGLLGGLWEFPTFEYHDKKQQALAKLLLKRYNNNILVKSKIGKVKHSYSHFKVDADLFLCTTTKKIKSEMETKWISFDEFNNYAFSKINHKLIQLVKYD
ncbi:A/G-specific adenine glycosylase [bacterium]|nr:MAG: A/G-specific adenine glycosylase [bacterium]